VQVQELKGQQELKVPKELRGLKVQVQGLKGQQELKEPKVLRELKMIFWVQQELKGQ
jgi:hypothetical protein